QIQGGALRYHLKKALSRSLNYDDFKIKLEKELKRTNFNSNTSRLIDEFMQNLEDFNREKEQFLEAKRIEQARIKEEERKRAEEIYQAQEANNLKDILEAEEKPLKDEFGVNFEGFKGKEAIEKLLEEQRGQVKGAFYKEGLGEIDLVWGDENFGLRHILEQRTKQWGEEKALKFISHLNENIEKGQIVEVQKGRAAIKTDLTTIILDKKENNNFVLTAFRDRNNKKELESLNLSQSKTFTSENAEANAKESPVTSLNQESIIAQKAKNDEVLEAEVIEEVGLNEPMKFLEFQQRKLLTYIKENTPLRLLEHKKELKTRDILNFLEQSALNGKQKVFLMRNLERDFTKLKEDFKELESQSFKRDLLDKTKPLRKAEKEELTSEVLEQVQKENLKLYLNDTSGNLTKFLNAKKPFKITMRGANIKHILNRHGENSTLAKNGQPFVNLEDIKKYDEIINNADRQILKENDKGEKTLLSGKQINGHYIVISSVRLKNGELKLKTMYKENGKLENDKAFKSVKLPSETPSVLRGQSLTTDLDGYPSHADESIAQNSQEAKIKEAVKNHNAIYKEILDNDYIFTDE
ncbi:PBECR3 domain-containing polyvalent protein, partial [Campylobacter upsaliensis]|uniref:PBECR3 domain-containing polyvalent protein n=1 Tax=Campylobacter upsaliensis TaxID=28080 RepID=UPI001BDA776F